MITLRFALHIATIFTLTAVSAMAAEKPYWVEPMQAVNAGFDGNPGYVAQFGDSITFSLAFWSPIGWDEPDAYLSQDDGLPKRPKEERWRDTLKGFRAKGSEHGNDSGWRVGNVLGAIDTVLRREQPEAALIMIGTNDISGGNVPADYRDGLKKIVQNCLDAHCVPILNTIPPRVGHDAAVEAANRIIREVARESQVPLADFHAACLQLRPGPSWQNTIISDDGVHPTGGQNNAYTEENMKVCGYALRNWVNFLALREVYFQVLAAPKKFVEKVGQVEPVRQGIRCELIADTQVSSYHNATTDERLWNWGRAPRLKCKGFEEYLLFKFDLAQCQGLTVHRATLYLSRTEQCVLNVTAPSTVSADWSEGTGQGGSGGPEAARGGATFSHAVYPDRLWAGPGSCFKHVVFGEGGSSFEARATSWAKDDKGEYYSVELPWAVIHGMLVEGDSYGLALTDEKGQRGFQTTYRRVPNPNHYVNSRESGKPCFLIVEGQRIDRTPPAAVSHASAEPGDEAGDVILRWTATGDDGAGGGRALGYRIYLARKPLVAADLTPQNLLPRYLTCRPKSPGQIEVLLVRGLEPGAEYHFLVVAYDKAGNLSPATAIRGTTRPARAVQLDAPAVGVSQGRPAVNAKLAVWAEPSNARINPLTGNSLTDGRYTAARADTGQRQGNTVFDGKAQRIDLAAGRNDFAGFQLAVENLTTGPLTGLEVRCEDLNWMLLLGGKAGNSSSRIAAKNVTIDWQWSVRDKSGAWYPDALVPHREPLALPHADNRIPGQRVQAFYLDVWVPHETPPGTYDGQIIVAARGVDPLVLPVRLAVWNFTLPDTLSFVCDMNGYGYPESKTWEGAINLHRLAHRHRLNVNIVPYSHAGNWTVPQMGLTAVGQGAAKRIADFTNFDRHFGPLLTGKAFADNPRAGVPVAAMFLPLYENWPCLLKDGFLFDQSAQHVDISKDFSDEYKQGYLAVCRQLAEHFQRKGYDRTMFHSFLNNKHQYAPETTFWLLDEPMFRDDYLVLGMFSELTREGFRGAAPVQVDFRVDCSRVEEVHGTFNHVDLFVGSTGNLREFRRLKDDQDLSYIRQPSGRPRTWWVYGGTCRPSDLPVANRAWAIDTFLAGFDGLLPWLAYGGDEAWDSVEAAENAVFYPAAKRWDYDGCYGSLRMKAFRDGQQDAEYLRLLCQHKGVTRRELAAALGKLLGPAGVIHKGSAGEAETFSYGQLSPDELIRFRWLLGQNLNANL